MTARSSLRPASPATSASQSTPASHVARPSTSPGTTAGRTHLRHSSLTLSAYDYAAYRSITHAVQGYDNGRLPARYVIHTVGPRYYQDPQGAPAVLANAYHASLEQAARHGAGTVSAGTRAQSQQASTIWHDRVSFVQERN